MPPSPVVHSLRGWNEKQAATPWGRPMRCHSPCHSISLPIAQAASSTTGTPAASAIGRIAREVARHPELVHREHGTRCAA